MRRCATRARSPSANASGGGLASLGSQAEPPGSHARAFVAGRVMASRAFAGEGAARGDALAATVTTDLAHVLAVAGDGSAAGALDGAGAFGRESGETLGAARLGARALGEVQGEFGGALWQGGFGGGAHTRHNTAG